ncbi:hypothetical protein M0638_08100 [Roseomonas sp. NAR14]|uniref:Uncharacterized protein n=1 Tax=Roseomonas acroporae TaxID=2937791 RepID=A0A9X1Y6D3_9PROT|nr:hypothetical protein [Roseomonas acroporae]MCK8784338.1 hypothetical protein [Roseomonas acroporae]
MPAGPIDPSWWITVVEIPVVAALFRMIHGLRRDLDGRIERGDRRDSDAVSRTRDDLAEFKHDVARTYVPLSLIRDVDARLTQHLLRIENKLERLARAAAEPPGRPLPPTPPHATAPSIPPEQEPAR